MTIRHRTSEDPVTVIGLIYRIVDEPRRAFAFAAILLPMLAAAVRVIEPKAVLAEWPARALWWSGTGALGLSWLLRAVARLRRAAVPRRSRRNACRTSRSSASRPVPRRTCWRR